MLKAEPIPEGAAFSERMPPGGRQQSGGGNADVEQAFHTRSFESSAEPSSDSVKALWWERWRPSYRSWQEVATSEKDPHPSSFRHTKTFTRLVIGSASLNLILLIAMLAMSAKWSVMSARGSNLIGSWAENEASGVLMSALQGCSGRGVRYADTIGPGCECHQCYEGLDCSQLTQNCTVDLSSGTPTLFQSFWASNLAASAALIPGTYRLGYSDGNLDALESAVRKLHDTVGNVNGVNKQLVMSSGSTQMIFGLLYAISFVNRERGFEGKMAVTSAPPYYNLYSYGTRMEASELFEWKAYADVRNSSAPSINFVVSPNNPDGRIGDPELPAPSIAVHDFAYYWPHFTPITAPMDHDVMLFTLSKVSGHAGSRVGWVWLRDVRIAEVLRLYLSVHSITMSHEAQYRATKVLNAIAAAYESASARTASLSGLTQQAAADYGRLFHFAKLVMQNRWDRLHSTLGTTGTDSKTRVTIQPIPPAGRCSFFQQTVTPSPPYAYLHCRLPEDTDCYQLLLENGIKGRPGTVFGGDASYVRLSLLGQESDFALSLERLKALMRTDEG